MSTQKEVAAHLDLSARRIRGLTKEGILPASKGPGGYDLDACRLAYIRYLRGVSSGQVSAESLPDDEGDGDDDYSRLLEKERHRREKRLNDEAEGLVAPLQLITDTLAEVASQIISHLEALPLEMKKRNPRLTGHDIETVKKAVARCRNACADIEVNVE